MEYHVDTLIIGAGPAGMGCAIALQKSHHDVCVIDKAVFPRRKTCAGLVTGKTYELIKTLFDDDDPEELFCFTASGLKLYRKTQLLADAPVESTVRLVNRIDFDNALVERYKALGGNIREGVRIKENDYTGNRVILDGGDTIGYHRLVFADGALSLSHKLIKVDKRKLAFGIEAYVPSDQLSTDTADIYFECIKEGYLWVFPHGDTVCVGVANLYDKNTDYQKILSDFLQSVGVDPSKQHYIGAFLPYGYAVPQDKLPDNVVLVGDAGGFTDPITGEGIYMALRTGMLAAQSMSAPDFKAAYLKSVQPLVSIVKSGKKVQTMFFNSVIEKTFLKKVQNKHQLVAYYYDNIVDDYHYDYQSIGKMFSDYKKGKQID